MKSGLKNRRAKERRQRVIQRLETQLKAGVKTNGKTEGANLTQANEKRIKKELAILAERI